VASNVSEVQQQETGAIVALMPTPRTLLLVFTYLFVVCLTMLSVAQIAASHDRIINE
jgi:hypothetical protein